MPILFVHQIRSASFATVLYMSCLNVFLAFLPGVDPNSAEEVYKFRDNVTIALWGGLLPVALLGATGSYYRQRFFSHTVVEKFKNAPIGIKSKYIYKFTDSREVEITARCCRK